MAHRLIIRAEAEADISDAATWYNNRQSGLGKEFLEQVEISLNRAKENPYLYQCLRRRPDVRRVLTHRFPYRIFFVLRPDAIMVFRVLHHLRHDREWKRQIPDV
jgi:toxin ParE1/3/4